VTRPRPRSTSGRRSARPDGAVLVGRRPVLEAVREGVAQEVFVATGTRATQGLRDLVSAAEGAGVRVHRVPAARIQELGDGDPHHHGVAARVRLLEQLGERELARRRWREDAIAVALDGVTDPGNVGAVARSAEGAGADALIVRSRRGSGLTRGAIRASAGALLHLPVAEVPNIPRALRRLADAGFWVVGLEGGAQTSVLEAERPSGRLVLVVGSEGAGLSRLGRAACDELLSIPLKGRVGSLNASVAAGVGLFGYALKGSSQGGTSRGGKAGIR
jgi:23S rRNA (guanosine2251-2'-O)-methyltransferase